MRQFIPKTSPQKKRATKEERADLRARRIVFLHEKGYTTALLDSKSDKELWQMVNRFRDPPQPSYGKLVKHHPEIPL